MQQEHYDGEHPFQRPVGSDASMFIQWKGTDVCLDFTCGACQESTHYDGGFAYFLRCPCGATYELGTQVAARLLPPDETPSMVRDLSSD
jgi:hypothetical protein